MPHINMKSKVKPVDLNTYEFTFGKYKGRPAKEIMEFNAGYLVWCHHNVEWFKLGWRTLHKVRKKAREQARGLQAFHQAYEQHFDMFYGDEPF